MIDSLYIHTIKQKPGPSLQVAKGHVNHPHSSFCCVVSGLLPLWLSPVTEVIHTLWSRFVTGEAFRPGRVMVDDGDRAQQRSKWPKQEAERQEGSGWWERHTHL